jgi:hypothetical protein
MSIKFNIYYSVSSSGPWTLANSTPIDRIAAGQEYTITGLATNTQYFIAIVPGTLDEDDSFLPLLSQAIGEEGVKAGGIETVKVPVFAARTFAPSITITGTPMGHKFTISSIV